MAEGSGGAKNIATWVLTVLLAALFAFAGFTKVSGAVEVASAFMKFGYPVWFSYIIGAIEIGCALLLFAPRVAAYAAGLLILVMFGAIVSHLRAGESPLTPVIVLVLLIAVAFLRRPQTA